MTDIEVETERLYRKPQDISSGMRMYVTVANYSPKIF